VAGKLAMATGLAGKYNLGIYPFLIDRPI